MQKQFAQKIEEMRRLIDNFRSASSVITTPSVIPSERSESRNLYLLAVSGGMDSMCMADLFLQTFGADSFAIAHCNFSLRAEESDGDEALVREWAERNGVRIFVKRFDTVSYARERGVSIEMAARDLRYGWFAELCREHGFAAVSVAHNANDNAETLLLNLLRGTGLSGLHGMAEESILICDDSRTDCGLHWPPPTTWAPPPTRGWENANSDHQSAPPSSLKNSASVRIFRPLLEFTRKQIEGYVFVRKVPYRHDSSNFSSDYKRNKIRNEVFPVFEKINPSFIRTLNREIGYFAEAGSIVEDWCKAHEADVVTVVEPSGQADGGHLRVDTAVLLATPHWRYLLYYILEPYGFNSQALASIESLLTSDRTIPGKRFESPTHILLTDRKSLTVLPLRESCSNELGESRFAVSGLSNVNDLLQGKEEWTMGGIDMPPPARGCLSEARAGVNGTHVHSSEVEVIRTAGTYTFNGIRFKVELLPWTGDLPLKQPQGILLMDADKMRFPFVCRRWRQGDWLVPLGMRGRKKVSDLFTDLKYDTLAKESAVMIVDTMTEGLAEQQHIAGLLGVRIDDRYKITAATKSVLRISLKVI